MIKQLIKTPLILRKFFPGLIWQLDTDEKKLHITFDDGPHKSITPWVLNCLKNFNAKATFFCLGENVKKNPAIYQRILKENHHVGNHTYNHFKGWFTRNNNYFSNIAKCREYVDSNLFRPPYGSITPKQIKTLKQKYKIIMWDVLSLDFQYNTSPKKCVTNIIKHTRPGSIIVFHDNEKSEKKMKYALPFILNHFSKLGYQFRAIPY